MRKEGFTLLEVAIALGILMVVLLYTTSFLGGSGATAQNARLAAQASEIVQYVDTFLARGMKELSPEQGQSLVLDYGSPELEKLIPIRNAQGRFKVIIENLGSVRTPEKATLYQYRVQVCYKLGNNEVCRQSTKLLPPPSELYASISTDKPINVEVQCPPNNPNLPALVKIFSGGQMVNQIVGCESITLAAGTYDIRPENAIAGGIEYKGEPTHDAANQKVVVDYTPISGALRVIFEYPKSPSGQDITSGGSVTVNGITYTASTTENVTMRPGTYSVTDPTGFDLTDGNLQYRYKAIAPQTIDIELGKVTELRVRFQPTNGYVRMRSVDPDSPTVTGGMGIKVLNSQGNLRVQGDVDAILEVKEGDAVYVYLNDDPSNPFINAHPLQANGFPRKASFIQKTQADTPPSCNEVRSQGAEISKESTDQNGNAIPVTKVPYYLGTLNYIYWCSKPAYGRLTVNSATGGALSIAGPAYDESGNPYLTQVQLRSGTSELFVPVRSSNSTTTYYLSSYPQNGKYPQISPTSVSFSGPENTQTQTVSFDMKTPNANKKYLYIVYGDPSREVCGSAGPLFPGDEVPIKIVYKYANGYTNTTTVQIAGPTLIEADPNATSVRIEENGMTGNPVQGVSKIEYIWTGPGYYYDTNDDTCKEDDRYIGLANGQVTEIPFYVGVRASPYQVNLKVSIDSNRSLSEALGQAKVEAVARGKTIWNRKLLTDLLSNSQPKSEKDEKGNVVAYTYEANVTGKAIGDRYWASFYDYDRMNCYPGGQVTSYYASYESPYKVNLKKASASYGGEKLDANLKDYVGVSSMDLSLTCTRAMR